MTIPEEYVQLTVADSQLAAKWDSFLQDYYRAQIQQAALAYPDVRSVDVEFKHIELRDPELAEYLLQRPRHALRVGETALYGVDMTVDPKPRLRLRVRDLPETVTVTPQGLTVSHLGRLVAVKCSVNKITSAHPEAIEAAWECKSCGNLVHMIQEEDTLGEPVMCEACEKTGNIWRHRDDFSRFVDLQKVELVELHEDTRGSRQPTKLVAYLRDDLIHSINPGDTIHANGILQTEARYVRNQKSRTFNRVLDVISIDHKARTVGEIEITEEDEAKIQELSRDPELVPKFRDSLAPTLYGLEAEKEAILLLLFGGVLKGEGTNKRKRGDIHVLLVGDPSCGKSDLIGALAHLAHHCVLSTGGGSSAAGLTAGVVKQATFGDESWSVEAGALVRAHGGVAAVDEFDKMNKDDQGRMHDAMERQVVSVAKTGVQAHMPSRCAVCAAANPKLERFDRHQNIIPQINLKPALLSRFDLIFALTDQVNQQRDAAIAKHLLRVHMRMGREAAGQDLDADEAIEGPLSRDFMRKYIAYSKRITPVLTEESGAKLTDFILDIRSVSEANPLAWRQAEGCFRLAEAYARWRLSPTVDEEDAQRAIDEVMASLRSVGIDVETGALDAGMISTSISSSQDARMRTVMDLVRRLAKESDKGYARDDDVVEDAKKMGMTEEQARKCLATLKRNNSTYAAGGSGTSRPL